MDKEESNFIIYSLIFGIILFAVLWFGFKLLLDGTQYSISNYIFVLLIGMGIECVILYIRFNKDGEIKDKLKAILDEIKKKDKEEKEYNKIVEDATEIYNASDKLIHDRINYFLVAESMLLFSFVTSLSNDIFSGFPNPRLLSITISIVGILITAMWYYNNRRLRIKMNISQKIRRKTGLAWELHTVSIRRTPTGQFVLTSLLPSIILFLWFFLLLFSKSDFTGNMVNEVNVILPFFILIFIIFRALLEILLPKNASQISKIIDEWMK